MLTRLRELLRGPAAGDREQKEAADEATQNRRRQAILEGPLTRTLVTVSWPLVLSGQIGHLIGIVVLFWVARLGGTTGIEVWALVTPLTSIATMLISNTLNDGSGALIAQSVGAGDRRGMAILRGALQLTALLTVAVLVPVAVFAGPLAEAIAGETGASAMLLDFMVPWLLVAFPIALTCDLLLGAVQVSGWTSFGLLRVVADLVLLGSLVPLFMGVLDLGMMGPPLAAGVSAGILALLVWRTLRRHAAALGLGDAAGSFTSVDRTIWRRILGIGLAPQLGRLAMWIAQLIYIQMLAHGAGSLVGGWGLALEALLILGLFSMSLAWGSAIMVGQNMGAGQWQRGAGVLIRAAGILAVLLIAFLAWTPFARPLFGLLSDDPAVLDAAMGFLSVMRWGWIGMVIYQLLNAAYTAVGATKLAGTFVILSEALGVAFAVLWTGPVFEAVAYGFCLSCGVRAVLMLALIRRSLLAPLAEAARKGNGNGSPQ